MGLLEIIFIGIGLSMDAVAVSMSNGMAYPRNCAAKLRVMPLFFGFFQGLMPCLGFFAGNMFAKWITAYSGVVIFLILGVIGGKMLWDGFHSDTEEDCGCDLTYKMLFMQAIATSIDAFAVGVGFSAVQVNVLPAVMIIGIITVLLCICAVKLGQRCGSMLGKKAQLFGGLILIIIGMQAIL